MGEYYSDDTNSFYTKLPALKQMLPLPAIAPAVGLTAAAGHKNASCGGWPQCANVTDKACGCIDYKWCALLSSTTSSFAHMPCSVQPARTESVRC